MDPETTTRPGTRFGFGRNWERFIADHFDEERVEMSRRHMLSFLKVDDLEGLRFLDVGCGSGLHSLVAHRCGARVTSFDFDPDSVRTTRLLHERAGSPGSWTVSEGSILDPAFVEQLPVADVVYAWGVLHHTGDMWTALENTCTRVAPGGTLYLALYDYDTVAAGRYSPEFWLDVKRMYNETGPVFRRLLEGWYVWDSQLGRRLTPRRIRRLRAAAREYKKSRGMAWMTDVRDWLGGWPMEYARVPEVEAFCARKAGLKLVDVVTGEANSEFRLQRPAAA